jgi:hypothetical protein
MKLWLRALPKRTRFHDLRHTTATLLLKEGVPMGVVQKILRHSDIKVTEGIYSHLDDEDVKKGLAKMPLTRGGLGHAGLPPRARDDPESCGGFCGEITRRKEEGREALGFPE